MILKVTSNTFWFCKLKNWQKSKMYLVWRTLLWSIWILNGHDSSLPLNLYFVSSKLSNLKKSCFINLKLVKLLIGIAKRVEQFCFLLEVGLSICNPLDICQTSILCLVTIPSFIRSRGNNDLVSGCIVLCKALMLRSIKIANVVGNGTRCCLILDWLNFRTW